MKIKLCGLCREADIDCANEVRPDYAGFVFANSKRQVTPEQAASYRQRLDPRIEAVGVFVNEEVAKIIELCDKEIIQMVQLHGDETEAYMQKLRGSTEAKIIKAVRVHSKMDIRAAKDLPADYLLLDTYRKGMYGGTGESFDWGMLEPMEKPFFLAGGISLDNISRALETQAYCLDISSGVETQGKKDQEKIREIMRAVRL